MLGEKEGENREKTATTLSEKKEEASNVSEQRDKGWIHVIHVSTWYNPLSSDNVAGQQTLMNYPTKKECIVLLNIETTPLTCTSLMNDITWETKGQANRKNSEWQDPVTSPTPKP